MPGAIAETIQFDFIGNEAPLTSAFAKAEASSKKHVSVVNAEFKGLGKTINVNEHFLASTKKVESEAKGHVGRLNSIFGHIGEGMKSSLEGIFSGAMSVVGGNVLFSGLSKIEQTTEKLLELGMEHQSAWLGAMKRMTAFTGSAVEADKVLGEIHELAVDRALEFKPLSEAAFKLTEIGYKGPEIVTMFKGITAQAIALGKGTEGVTRLIGMLQMIEDSGKAAGRGLMQLERQGYQIFATLEKVTGLDRRFLNKALSQGRLDPRAAIGMLTEGWEQQFGELAGKLSHSFKDEQTRLSEMMSEPLATVVSPLVKSAKHVVVDLQQIFSQVGPGLAEGLGKGLGFAADKLTAGLDFLIELTGIKLQTKSPSKVFEQYGVWVMQGLGDGFVKGRDRAQTALEKTYQKILSNEALQKKVQEASSRFNVPANLISAVIAKESSGVSRAVSPAGAKGLMQLMPGTASRHGVTDVFNPTQNIMGGTAELAQLMARFPNDIAAALAHYNWSGKGSMPAETKDYVTRITGLLSGTGSISKAPDTQLKQVTDRIAELNKFNFQSSVDEMFGRIERLRGTLGYSIDGSIESHARIPEPGIYPRALTPEEQTKRAEVERNLTAAENTYLLFVQKNTERQKELSELYMRKAAIERDLAAQANAKITWGYQRAAGMAMAPGSPQFEPPIQYEPPKLRRGITEGGITPDRTPSELEMEMRKAPPGLFRRQAIESVKPLEGFQNRPIDAGIIVFHAALSKLERSTIRLNEAQESAIGKALQKEPLTDADLSSIKQVITANREFSTAQKEAITSALENNELTKEQIRLLSQVVFKFEAVGTLINRGLTQQVEEAPQKIRETEADAIIGIPQRIGEVAFEFLTKFDFTWKSASQMLLTGFKSVVVEPVAHVFQQVIQKWVAQQLVNLLGEKIMGTTKVASETANTAAISINTATEIANTVALGLLTAAIEAQATADLISGVGGAAGAGGGGGEAAAKGGVVGYSKGTPLFPGGIGLVGEEGPEMVHLPTGSHIYTHNETRSMLKGARSGGDTNISITLNAPVMQGSSYATPPGRREYLEMLVGPLREAMKRAA